MMAPMMRLTLLLAALTLAFLSAHAHAEDGYQGPEMGQSLDPDDLTVESEDPDDMVGGSEDPDDLVGDSEDLDAHRGDGYELGGLPADSGSANLPAPMPQLVAKPPAPTFDDSPEVHAAERNMDASNDIYTHMVENDYPRGTRRERIIEERRAAFENVNRTRRHYMELLDQ